MIDMDWVWEDLTAWHTDPFMGEGRHQHTWRVTAFFAADPPRDARSMKASLRLILDAWEGRDLPPELWSGRALARAVWQCHGNADCIGVKVERVEGFGAGVGAYR